jgi:DnaK suppressor protein
MNNDTNLRYSEEELKEFEEIINSKLERAKKELNYLRETVSKANDSGTDITTGNIKMLEDGADSAEKESLSQLAGRQQRYISQLDAAIIRIKNGTYGVCIDTGKLIPKERLRAVPHTQHTIEAKIARDK